MIVHNVIDVSPLYYRYVYRMRYSEKSDIPVMYFVLREIEAIREGVESRGADAITSACFDAPNSFRKQLIRSEQSDEYKSGRKKVIDENDFRDIEIMKNMLRETGVNVFCKEGCEADDLMAKVANHYKDDFELTVLYSTDKDMMVNIKDSIGMRRYIDGIWRTISESNFVQEASESFKTTMPYNAIGLYLSTVGDTADRIPGIRKFGPKAFEKLVRDGNEHHIDWSELTNYDKVAETLIKCRDIGIISDEQLKEAVNSFNMVRTIEIGDSESVGAYIEETAEGFKTIKTGMVLPGVLSVSSADKRIQVYNNAGMKSLAK